MPFRKKEEAEQAEPQSEEVVVETPVPAPRTARRRTPSRRAAAPVVEAPPAEPVAEVVAETPAPAPRTPRRRTPRRRAAAPVAEAPLAPPAEPVARVKRHRPLAGTRVNDRRRG
jgi:hypothetical protein